MNVPRSTDGLATAFSLSPVPSLVGFSTRYGGLIPTLLYAATMAAVVGLFWERPERLRWLVWAIAVASVVVAVSVLGTDGKVNIFNSAGTIHVITDVAGWFNDGT